MRGIPPGQFQGLAVPLQGGQRVVRDCRRPVGQERLHFPEHLLEHGVQGYPADARPDAPGVQVPLHGLKNGDELLSAPLDVQGRLFQRFQGLRLLPQPLPQQSGPVAHMIRLAGRYSS